MNFNGRSILKEKWKRFGPLGEKKSENRGKRTLVSLIHYLVLTQIYSYVDVAQW